MNPASFTPRASGQLIVLRPPVAGLTHAFVPNPLPPPDWQFPTELHPLLIDARVALASLNGIARHLPNPDILLRPIQRREARLSSQLEGTMTDPEQQALFEADPQLPTLGATDQLKEVFNYSRALRLYDGTLPLCNRLIKNLHAVLMEGVRGYHERPGEFRTKQNQINRPARYVPPPPDFVDPWMNDLERYLNESDTTDPLVKAFLSHYQFEAIHPFADGNGRVGRLLLALTIQEWCGHSEQWLYMSAYFERSKQDYMDRMLRVSTHGDWTAWIEFCLRGVVIQAKDTETRCDKLVQLHQEFRSRIKAVRGSVRLGALVDQLFITPALTVVGAKHLLNVSYPTAKSDLQKLETHGIVRRLERAANLAFYCDQIYNITYEED